MLAVKGEDLNSLIVGSDLIPAEFSLAMQGYHVHRLAADLRDMLQVLNLKVRLMGKASRHFACLEAAVLQMTHRTTFDAKTLQGLSAEALTCRSLHAVGCTVIKLLMYRLRMSRWQDHPWALQSSGLT